MYSKKIPVVRGVPAVDSTLEVLENKNLPKLNPDEAEKYKEDIRKMIKSILGLLLQRSDLSEVLVIEGPQTTIFEIDLVQEDFGRLMGERGKHITALRTLVHAAAGSRRFRSIVRIKDEDRFF